MPIDNKSKVLFFLLDAFRHDYINEIDTPFLFQKTKQGVYGRKLKSTTGFTQLTAIHTGTVGDTSGSFTMYTFDSDNSPFRFLRQDSQLARMGTVTHWWHKLPGIKGVGIWRLQNKLQARFEQERVNYRKRVQQEVINYANYAPLAHIPLHILPEIGMSEGIRPIHLPGGFTKQSIIDVFVKHDIRYRYLLSPVVNIEDDYVTASAIDAASEGLDIFMGQFSNCDYLVHHCGPSATKRREIMGEIDRKLRSIHAHYPEDTTWIIIGDHGMTDVVEEIDIPKALAPLERSHDVIMGRDYILFLDSTMARFLWKTDSGKRFLDKVIELPVLSSMGKFIDERLAKEYAIPLSDRRYGDLIWWANPGVLLFPDYFHDERTHNKGMHGYDSNHDDMKGFFLAFGPGINPRTLEQVDLIDVCPSICKALNIPAPTHNMGKCLL